MTFLLLFWNYYGFWESLWRIVNEWYHGWFDCDMYLYVLVSSIHFGNLKSEGALKLTKGSGTDILQFRWHFTIFLPCLLRGTNLTNTKLQKFHIITRIHIKLQKFTKIYKKTTKFLWFLVILCEFLWLCEIFVILYL